jgi:hypothetical protein
MEELWSDVSTMDADFF